MSKLTDAIKKNQEEKQGSQDTAPAVPFGGEDNAQPSKLRQSIMTAKSIAQGGEQERYNGFKSWLDAVGAFSDTASNDLKGRDGKYQDSAGFSAYRGRMDQQIDDLLKQGADYKDYFTTYGGAYNKYYTMDDGSMFSKSALDAIAKNTEYLESVREGLRGEDDFWAKFTDENDYRISKAYGAQKANSEIGQYGKGNIDLYARPQYAYQDGGIATVESISIGEDGKEILIPTIAYDANGKPVKLTDQQAIDRYHQTGQYLGKFDTVEEADAYAQRLHEAQDFYYGSRYTSTRKPEEVIEENKGPLGFLVPQLRRLEYGDIMYDYINKDPEAVSVQQNADIAAGLRQMGLDESQLEGMKPEEVSVFNYLYNPDDPALAYEYIKRLNGELNYRQRMETQKEFQRYADQDPFGSSVFSVMVSPAKGISYLMQAADYLDDGAIDQNAGYNKFSYIPNAIRAEVSQNIEKNVEGFWGKAGSFGYQTGMSMADFLLNTAISGGSEALTLTIMGTGAAADATISAKDRGMDDTRAFVLGTIAGAAEIITEKVSLEALLKPNWEKGTFVYILKNMLAEGSEEGASDFINWAADGLYDLFSNTSESEFKQMVAGYVAQGMTEEEARSKAIADRVQELGLDMLGGALSGGIMAGGGAGIKVVNDYNTGRQFNGMNLSAEDIQTFIDEGLASDPSTQSYKLATELQAKLANGGTLTNYELGNLYNANVRAIDAENAAAAKNAPAQPQTVTTTAQEALASLDKAQATAPATTITPATRTAPESVSMPTTARSAAEDIRATRLRQMETKAQELGKMGRKTVTDFFNPDVREANSYYKAFSAYYEAGISGSDITGVKTPYASELNEAARQAAYFAGQVDAQASLQNELGKVQYATVHGKSSGLIQNEYSAKLSAEDASYLNAVARAGGVKVQIEAPTGTGGANGWYSTDGILHIASDAESDAENAASVVAAHEITHRMQEVAPKQYRAYRNYVMQTISKNSKVDVDVDAAQYAVAQIKADYAKHGVTLSTEQAMDEIAANFTKDMMENVQQFRDLANTNRNLAQKLLDTLREFIRKVKAQFSGNRAAQDAAVKNAYGMSMAEVERAAKLWGDALRETSKATAKLAEGKQAVKTSDSDVRFSVKNVGGKNVVWIENSDLTNAQLNSHAAVAAYIADHIGEVYTIIESGQKVYIGEDLPNEYTQSQYTGYLRGRDRKTLRAKNKAVSGLGELIETATNRRWEQTVHSGNKDAKYGMYRYDSTFAFPTKGNDGKVINVRAYDVELLIRNASDGKKYLYDIVNIKENTTTMLDLQQREARKGSHQTAARGSASDGSLTETGEDVKRYSLKEVEKLDADYAEAVEAEDTEAMQRMVDEAAKAAGYDTPKLYHGTPSFGFTEFKGGTVWLTSKESVAAGYGKTTWANVRRISDVYSKDDGKVSTLVKNAKNILRTNVHQITTQERQNIVREFNDAAANLDTRAVDIWSSGAVDVLSEVNKKDRFTVDGSFDHDGDLDNALAYTLGFPGLISSYTEDIVKYGASIDNTETAKEILSDAEQFDRYIEPLRSWMRNHHADIAGTEAEGIYKLIIGYDLSDFKIDAQYKLARAFDGENMVSDDNGGIVTQDALRDCIEQVKNVGSYQLYANLGDKPLIIEGGGHFWTNIPVEQWGSEAMTTDAIVERAREQGYTSVVMKDIMDVAMNNYTSNERSDVYVLFQPSQAKSADPVTYDDAGKVIPLSQRFQSDNEDIRYSIKGDTARWTQDRIDSVFEDYAASAQDYSKAYVTWLSPDEFLSLTTTNPERIRQQALDAGMTADSAKDYRTAIKLSVDADAPGQVYGHEGRHRITMMKEAGVKRVPVVIEFWGETGKSNRQPLDALRLTGEEWSGSKASGNVLARDLLPISKRYRSAIEAEFGEDGGDGVRFSMKSDSDGKQLSDSQAAFFQNSKAVDDQGRLMRLFHGSKTAGFTQFAKTDDIGFFFTSRDDVAATYAGTYEPFDPFELLSNWDEVIETIDDNNSWTLEQYRITIEREGDGYVLKDNEGKALRSFKESELSKCVRYLQKEILPEPEEVYGKTHGVYSVYLNLENPLVIDGHGQNWDRVFDYYEGLVTWPELTAEQQEAFEETYGEWVKDYGTDEDTGELLPIYDPQEIAYSYPQKTRAWVADAKEMGYDGVIFRNIVDSGGAWDAGASDVYVAMRADQIKSTGNLDPTSSDDIRYSLKEDSSGRGLTDQQAEFFADSKSVDREGRLKVMWQGGDGDFTVFDRGKSSHSNLYGRGFYFTDSESHAKQYGNARAFYLNITKPVSTTDTTITRAQMRAFLEAVKANEDDYSFENYGEGATVDSVLKSVYSGKSDFAMLYDVCQTAIGDMVEAVELYNSVTGAGYDGLILDTETVTFRSEQAKAIDNLSPTSDPDIRYSMKGMDDIYARYSAMAEENRTLRSQLSEYRGLAARQQTRADYWQGQTRRTKEVSTDAKAVSRAARGLLKDFSSKADVKEITADLQSLYDYIARGHDGENELTGDEVWRRAFAIADDIVSAAVVVDDGFYQQYSDLREYIRKADFHLSVEDSHDIADYGDFRKSNFGRIHLGGGHTNIDQYYQEMASMWPEFFDESKVSTPSDQLLHIIDVLDTISEVAEANPFSEYYQEAQQGVANQIIEEFFELPQTKATFADRQAAKLDAQKAADRAKLDTLRAEKNAKIEQLRQQNKERVRQAIADERAAGERRIERMKEHSKEVKARKAARRADSQARTRLLKIARRLQNAKLPAVNRALLNEYIGDLDTVAKSITGKTLENLRGLQEWYNDQKRNNPDFIADPATERKLERLSKRHIADLSAQEVAELTEALLNIENEIRTQRQLIDLDDRRDTYHMGEDVIRDLEATRGSKSGGVGSVLDRFIVTETLSPVRQVRRMTGYVESDPLLKLTSALADGQRAMMDYQMRAQQPFQKFAEDKAFNRAFSGGKATGIEITGMTKDGTVTVTISPAMRASLYLHSLNDQNMKHIAEGGVTVPDWELYRKGKLSEAYARGTTIKLTPSAVRSIAAGMTEQERAFARAVAKYFTETSQPAINAVSEKLKGYSIAQVENYFPINTDTSFTRSDFEAVKFDGTIEGMGFLKERVNAANPIVLRDANSVLDQAIQMHAKYTGLAIPVRNFNKVWGVTTGSFNEDGTRNNFEGSVMKAVKAKWGESGYDYIENLMADIQGGRTHKNRKWDRALNSVRSNYAGAVLTLNASVAIKQAASYPTAAAVLGWAPLMKAMGNFGKVDLDLIAKYTPLQWYRSQGFSTKELGDLKKTDTLMSKVLNVPVLNWVQGVDLATTRKLWKASEYYVRANSKELTVGTDAYYRAVADIYNRVIEETQPNYTTMQRPQILRTDSTLLQNLTMFKTQPFQNFNILYDAAGNLISKTRQHRAGAITDAELKTARQNFSRAVTSQIAQLAVFAGMTSLWAAFRGKKDKFRDKDDEITFESVLGAIGKDMVSGLFSDVPFGSDAWEFLSSELFGDKYYGMDAVTVTAIADTLSALKGTTKLIKDTFSSVAKGETVNWNSVRIKTDGYLDSISKIVGVPYENVANLFNASMRWVCIKAQGKYQGEYTALKWTTDPDKYKADYYDLLYKAMTASPSEYKAMYADMLNFGFDEKKIKTAMETRMKADQGVKSVDDLESRYLSPTQQVQYDKAMGELRQSGVWKAASAEQREKIEASLYEITAGSSTGQKMQDKIDGGAEYGLTAIDYLLFMLSLAEVDQPTESGKLGTYTNDEREEAIEMLMGISQEAKSYIWTTWGGSDKSNPYD